MDTRPLMSQAMSGQTENRNRGVTQETQILRYSRTVEAPHPFVLELPEEFCDYHVYKKTGRALNELGSKAALVKRIAIWAGKQSGRRRR
jgi:hypothetical protein